MYFGDIFSGPTHVSHRKFTMTLGGHTFLFRAKHAASSALRDLNFCMDTFQVGGFLIPLSCYSLSLVEQSISVTSVIDAPNFDRSEINVSLRI